MSNSPIAVQISSLKRTIRATKMPALAVSANPLADIRKPPSRPPNYRSMKKSMLAKSDVKARMSMLSR